MPTRERAGRPPLRPSDRRDHTVGVRLNDAEYARLKANASRVRRAPPAYLRLLALQALPPSVPPINRAAWLRMSDAAADLNRLVTLLREGRGVVSDDVLAAIRAELYGIRMALLGRLPSGEEIPSSVSEDGRDGYDEVELAVRGDGGLDDSEHREG